MISQYQTCYQKLDIEYFVWTHVL